MAVKVIAAVVIVLTLAGAYALGRQSQPAARPVSIESFRASLKLGDTLSRTHQFHRFVQQLGRDNVEQAAEVLEERNMWLIEDELRNFMIAWTRFDAPGAFAWAGSRRRAFSLQATGAVLYGWAFHDPEPARAAFESLKDSALTPKIGEEFLSGWLQGGQHDGVMEYISTQPDDMTRQKYTNLLTIELVRGGPEAVVEWVESIPDDANADYKTVAFQKAGNIIASVDPVFAARWIEGHLEHAYSARTPSVIGARWVERDPEAALDWVASLPASRFRKQTVRTNFLRWRRRNADDAEQWLRSAAPAASIDVLVKLMLAETHEEPATAVPWANRIHHSGQRLTALVPLCRQWLRKDRAAAMAWLDASKIRSQTMLLIMKPTGVAVQSGQRQQAEHGSQGGGPAAAPSS